LKCKDIYEGIEEKDVDRIVLDLPEPWKVIPYAINSLKSGGNIIVLLPTIVQVMAYVEELSKSKKFYPIDILETMLRYWNVKDRSVRPEHFMVAHTAFLVIARKIEDDASLFDRGLEHWKIDYI
jgi:tRNA (adenine57-N1/adenine58-N1)-methyltransferase